MMLTKVWRGSLGTHSSPRPAAFVIWRKACLMLCWSSMVPIVVVKTRPVSCHISPAFRRWAAWAVLRLGVPDGPHQAVVRDLQRPRGQLLAERQQGRPDIGGGTA